MQILNRAADNIRILAASMVEKAKSGHPGGAMGGADFINVLFSEFLVYDPANPRWAHRDRFFLDPGHMSPMLYSVLSLCGKYTMSDLEQFRQWGSITPGHPEVDVERGVENTSGPLGQGHTMAVGAAIAERFLAARFGEWTAHKIYAFISDGGVQEEISQGAGRVAGTLGLSNLIMFYDANNIQLSTCVDEVSSENTAAKYEAWGWRVITIDGNNAGEIRSALTQANAETQRPTLIIGKTLMGKGALKADGTDFSNRVSTHGQPLGDAGASLAKTIENLGGDPENPFRIFPEVEKLYAERKARLTEIIAGRKAKQAVWEKENPVLAAKLTAFFSGKIPEIDFSAIEQKPDAATRVASSTVLAVFAEKIENMVVASADLSNSDKTDGFLKKTKAFVKGDFSGAFFQAGVCELTMACIMNGMALHGGIIPVCATFFVFSDYMKPAMRMSALMELPVKYVFSHDAFRVGEDGPTHQPVEQEAQIRLLEQLKNHHGRNSMLVFRPADVNETTVAWQAALENTQTPTALILSRQNIKNLPADNAYEQAQQLKKGAYIVLKVEKPDVVLLANGSEVSTLVSALPLLEADGIRAQVVSAPSEGLFFEQTAEYRNSVIPAGVPVFGLTAGLPVSLQRLAGINGTVAGLEHFGYSAPYTVLDEKFGFTAQAVYVKVKKMLGRN
ncbi:MAG: transketolase [Prevotellaceae bacterium]|jgi:transketolase|nr:transketolase [Prevotellaceae bacterium]